MWEKGVPWKLSAVVKVRKLTLSSCYGSERSNTDTGIFINLYTFQQKLQMSARARQRKHEQERPINNNTNICKAHIVCIRAESDGFKAAHVARLDRDLWRGEISVKLPAACRNGFLWSSLVCSSTDAVQVHISVADIYACQHFIFIPFY